MMGKVRLSFSLISNLSCPEDHGGCHDVRSHSSLLSMAQPLKSNCKLWGGLLRITICLLWGG